MNVLLFSLYSPTPLLETELEFVRTHTQAGDDVTMVQCTGTIPTCHWNPEHRAYFCAFCRSRFEHGIGISVRGGAFRRKSFPPAPREYAGMPDSFPTVESLKNFTWDGERIGLSVASSLISKYYRDHRLDTLQYARQVRRELRAAIHVYETMKAEMDERKPDRVYVFNGRISTHAPIILLCRKRGIDFYTYEVAGTQNCYLLRKNSTPHSIDAAREEIESLWRNGSADRETVARTWFEQRRGGIDQGIISFTKHQDRGVLPPGFDRAKHNIVIFNSTIEEYAAVDGWENRLYSPDETVGVQRIAESLKSHSEIGIYLRVHPHMKRIPVSRNSQLEDIRRLERTYDNLHVIWPADTVHSYALMDACEKVITFGSTIGLEAAYWGKPSILAGRALYEHLDCLYTPRTHEELIALVLNRALPPLPKESALRYGYREMRYGTPYTIFKQTGVSAGLFDGTVVQAEPLPRLIWTGFQTVKRASARIAGGLSH
jgi:hypothetical protein